MPPPSSGGIAVLQILGAARALRLGGARARIAEAAHLIAEAGRLAFADRDLYIADPTSCACRSRGLLDPGYLDARARRSSSRTASMGKRDSRASRRAERARAAPRTASEQPAPATSRSSTRDGNAVSMTTTIEDGFGAG